MDQGSGGSRNGTTATVCLSINPCSPRRPLTGSFAPPGPRGADRGTSRCDRTAVAGSTNKPQLDPQPTLWKGAQMRRGFALFGLLAAVAIAAVAAMLTGQGPSSARASSHSEAPLISQDPRADNTDLYAFVDPNDTSKIDVRRQLHPARSSGQRAELPELRRRRSLRDQDRQHGRRQGRHRLPVRVHDRDAESGHVPLQHRSDRVAERPELEPTADVHGHARPLQAGRQDREGRQEQARRAGHSVPTPPDNIGPRSTPNYNALAAAAVTSAPGWRQGLRRPA